jgi:hypothetical protein
MVAAKNGHRAVVKYLLGVGADPSLKDTDGGTAADWARGHRNGGLALILEAAYAPPAAPQPSHRPPHPRRPSRTARDRTTRTHVYMGCGGGEGGVGCDAARLA